MPAGRLLRTLTLPVLVPLAASRWSELCEVFPALRTSSESDLIDAPDATTTTAVRGALATRCALISRQGMKVRMRAIGGEELALLKRLQVAPVSFADLCLTSPNPPGLVALLTRLLRLDTITLQETAA